MVQYFEYDDIIEVLVYTSIYILAGMWSGVLIDKAFEKMSGLNKNKSTIQLWGEIILQGAVNVVLAFILKTFIKRLAPMLPYIDGDKAQRFEIGGGSIVLSFSIWAGQSHIKKKVKDVLKR